jgi:branched-chain amino acid transport system substrate-binding protein
MKAIPAPSALTNSQKPCRTDFGLTFPLAARIGAGAFVCALACGASAQESPADGVYKDRIDWGVMMDLSGPTAASQGVWVNGFQDYIRKVNEAGGVHGRRINVLAEDSRFNPAQDRISYEKLLTQTPALGISGFGNSSAQVSLAPAVRAGKVPVVGTYASTRAMLEPASPVVYGGFCGLKEMAQTGVGYFAERLKLKTPKVMTVSIETAGGKEYHEYITAAAAKAGGTAVITTMKITAADVTPQVLEIIKEKPDIVTVYGISNTAILTMRTMQQYGLKIPTFGISYLGSPQIFTSMGPEAGANYHFVSCFTPGGADETPGNKELSATADKYGRTGMKARVGKEPTRAKLVESMNKGFVVDSKGLTAPITFTKDDHAGPVVLKTFGYDYAAKKFKAFGEYSDYLKYTK